MREIKFRAWDGKTIRKDVTGFEHGKENEMAGVFLDGNYYKISEFIRTVNGDLHPRAIVMQFTGLKDKNGKEIYEGDIIHFKHDGGVFVYERTTPVDWYQDCYGTGWGRLTQHEEIEVIGNIYENEDLLNHD